MPKRTQAEYESDGGFVEDVPKGKKAKSAASKEKKKPVANTEQQVDDDGNVYWELSSRRRLGVSTYKGATMVNIREYYEKDGKDLPGKKGISLSIDQYTTLLAVLPELETLLEAKGEVVPRPEYDGAGLTKKTKQEGAKPEESEDRDQGQDEGVEEVEDAKPAVSSKLDKYKLKGNHEATSDEDED